MKFEDRFARAVRKANYRIDRRSRVNRKQDIERELDEKFEDEMLGIKEIRKNN